MLKQFLKDYLSFGKRDRIGILALVVLIILAYFLPAIFPKRKPVPPRVTSLVSRPIDSGSGHSPNEAEEEYRYGFTQANNPTINPSAAELFSFDPNTLDQSGWERLGLNKRTIRTILNYRNKGGKFYKPEDLKKIWGLPEGFYERVHDHIHIMIAENKFHSPGKSINNPQPSADPILLNHADTIDLISLPGIGSKLASRIISFRNKLGGFHSIEQVGETYGLPDSVFQKIKTRFILDGEVKKIDINLATKEELKEHPYFKWKLANAIIEYRNQHGNFSELEELKKISLISDEVYVKILPYLTLQKK